MMADKRIIVGLLLLISGIAFAAVSLWMLVDTIKVIGIDIRDTTDAPKVGMAAGVIAAVVGVGCMVIKNLESMRNILLGVILVSLIFAITTFALAIKDRMDIKKAEDALDLMKNLQNLQGRKGFGINDGSRIQNIDIKSVLPDFDKLKTQLIVLIVAGVIACLLQITALVIVFKLQPSQSSRNVVQLGKPH